MPSELEQRLELAGAPGNTVRGISVNAVLRLIAQHGGEEKAKALSQIVAKKAPIDFFSYPAASFMKLQEDAMPVLLPKFGDDVRAVRVAYGESSLGGFFESAVGKTLLNIVGRGDPKRLLTSAATAYGTQVSYGKRTFEVTNEKSGVFKMRGDFFWPDYHVGVLTAAIRTMGVEGARVEAKVESLVDVDYHCRWE